MDLTLVGVSTLEVLALDDMVTVGVPLLDGVIDTEREREGVPDIVAELDGRDVRVALEDVEGDRE